MRQRPSGQALALVALLLPVLLGLLLVGLDLAGRRMREREVQDALRAANRSAVQTFDYAAFAEDRLALADAKTVISVARHLAAVNLRGTSGLTRPPDTVADEVSWAVLPAGGACHLEADRPALRFPAPALCAVADVELVSPLGLTWTTQIFAADTLDLSFAPQN